MPPLDALWIGLGQTLAVIPGISRAGSTLVVALWCGLEKETAVRFSFLLSVPVILGSTVLMVPGLNMVLLQTGIFELLVSLVASFVFALIGYQVADCLSQAQQAHLFYLLLLFPERLRILLFALSTCYLTRQLTKTPS